MQLHKVKNLAGEIEDIIDEVANGQVLSLSKRNSLILEDNLFLRVVSLPWVTLCFKSRETKVTLINSMIT